MSLEMKMPNTPGDEKFLKSRPNSEDQEAEKPAGSAPPPGDADDVARFRNILSLLSGSPAPFTDKDDSEKDLGKAEKITLRMVKLVLWTTLAGFGAFCVFMLVTSLLQRGNYPLVFLVLLGFFGLCGILISSLIKSRKASLAPTISAGENGSINPPVVEMSPISPDGEVVPSENIFPLQTSAEEPVAKEPLSVQVRLIRFAVSLLLWFLVASWIPNGAGWWLVGVILFHEAGHFLAMWLLGYSQLQMFFIPMVAGVAMGTKENQTPSDELIMLLAGPVPGLLLGCLIYICDALHPLPFLRSGAIYLVAINLLNLLPMWPLDGGRICWTLFSRQSALMQTILFVASFTSAVFLFFSPEGGICLGVILLWVLISLAPHKYREAVAAFRYRQLHPLLPKQMNQLSERQLWDLYQLFRNEKDDQSVSISMTAGFSRAQSMPASSPPLYFLVAYIALWVITVMTAAAGTGLQQDAKYVSTALSTLINSALPRSGEKLDPAESPKSN